MSLKNLSLIKLILLIKFILVFSFKIFLEKELDKSDLFPLAKNPSSAIVLWFSTKSENAKQSPSMKTRYSPEETFTASFLILAARNPSSLCQTWLIVSLFLYFSINIFVSSLEPSSATITSKILSFCRRFNVF